MNPLCLLFGGLLHLKECQIPQSGPVVMTSLGPIEGTQFPGFDGSAVRAFRGIPYGRVEARGQPSVPLPPWKAVRNAGKVAPPCPAGSNTGSNEDCLVLNVYLPTRENRTDPLPTLILLLSDELVPASPASPSPSSLLASSLIPKGIALVTVQYRTGVFGFLHSESPNTGLFDVVNAMRFILDNVGAFGLDSTKLTLAGFGDGAQVASVFSLSPASKGQVNGLVLLSGSSFSIGGQSDPTDVFLSRLNCGNMTESVCFRHLTLQDAEEAADKLQFHPTVGEMLVPSEPSLLLDSRHNIPTLMTIADFPDLGVSPEEFDRYMANLVKRFEKSSRRERIKAEEKIRNFYYPMEDDLIEEQFAELKSDVSFRIAAIREAAARSVYAPVYVSKLDDDYNELMLLLEAGTNPQKSFLVDSIVQFVKTGNPSSSAIDWPQFGSDRGYLFVGNTTFPAKDLLREETDFWTDLSGFMGKDLFTGSLLPGPSAAAQLSSIVVIMVVLFL